MNEHLIGFHLKIVPELIKIWDQSRANKFSIQKNISNTFSVDVNVWPNCKNEQICTEIFKDYYVGQNNVQNGLNIFCIKNESVLHHHSRYNNEGYLIALSMHDNITNHFRCLKEMHSINIPCCLKQIQDAGWVRLGYDVADYWLYSGLMNCSFDDLEKNKLHHRFVNSFNKYGLFNLLNDADEFRVNLDLKVPDHSPFAVYGIWAKE